MDISKLTKMSSIGITKDIDELLNQHHLLDQIIGPIDKCTKDILFEMNASQKYLMEHASIFNQNLIDPFYKSLENVHSANASILKSFKNISEQISLANYNAVAKFANIVPPKEVLTLASEISTSLTQYADIALKAEKSSAILFASNFLNATILDPIQSLQIDFQNQYGELHKNIFNKDFLTNLNPLAVTQFSSTELLLNNNLIETMIVPITSRHPLKKEVKVEIQKRSNDVISKKLNKVSPVFLIALNGAREAIYSDNEDKCRHVVSSYRELIKKLIFKLTPVEKVKKWAPDSSYFLRDKPDTPTYKAHILYLTQESKSKDLNKFLWIDIDLLIKQIRILDNLDHSDNPSEKVDNLESLSLRVESCIAFLLQFID